jgi:radical SAM protein with 4Fe4S-binding SPASM domain
MKFYIFERLKTLLRSGSSHGRTYFCQEPWIGIFSVWTDGEVICCPCYAKVKVGNVNDSSPQEIWNSKPLVRMRRAFRQGKLPRQCRKQLCPVALGRGMGQGEQWPSATAGVDRQGHA